MKTGITDHAHQVVIICLIILSVFSFLSCSNAKEEKQPPIEISFGYWNSMVSYADDELTQYIEKKFNIRIKLIPIDYYHWESDYKERIISDCLPDLFYSDYLANSTYDYLINKGYIADISEKAQSYPNLSAYLKNSYFDYFRPNGKHLYCIPRIGYKNDSYWGLNRVFLVRKDWMEQKKMPMPENYSEFKKMLAFFRDGDPDGNGIDDTYGLEIQNSNKIEALYLGINPYFSNIERGWIQEDSTWIPVWCSKDMDNMLFYFDELYELGLLNPDFAFMNDTQCVEDFLSGKVGCIAYPYLSFLKLHPEAQQFIEKNVRIMHPWKIEGQDKPYRFTTTNHWSEIYINDHISNNKKDKILLLIDYLLSKEFLDDIEKHKFWKQKSFQMFFEFIDYDISDYFQNGYIPLTTNIQAYLEQEKTWVCEDTIPIKYRWDIILTDTPAKSQMPSNIEIHNSIVRAILSPDSIDRAWQVELQTLKRKYPIDDAIGEVTRIHPTP